jgi:hypothetical protein
MKYAKYILLAILAIAVFTITACEEEQIEQRNTTTDLLIGGDEHGCNPNEGYTYCPTTAQCQRVWETLCPEYEEYYREPGICTMEYMPVTGEITFPCDEGRCTITETFGNRCVAETAGATNIKPLNLVEDELIRDNDAQDKYDSCARLGGTPLREYNECEGITANQCTSLGGVFLECESACRNDPEYPEVMCIEVCVEVCRFN